MGVYRCRICGEVYIGEEKPRSCPFCGAHREYAAGSDLENIREANRRERNAVKFYGQAGSQASGKEIKEFFKALMQIESDHILLTETKSNRR